MLKLLVFVALVLAILYFFSWRNRRPPGDWRRDDDGGNRPDGPPGRRLSLPQERGQDTEKNPRPRETAGADDDIKGG